MKQLEIKNKTIYYLQPRQIKVTGCKWIQVILECLKSESYK